MKRLVRSTRAQKEIIAAAGLDSRKYQIEKDNSKYLYVRDPKDLSDWHIIEKETMEEVRNGDVRG